MKINHFNKTNSLEIIFLCIPKDLDMEDSHSNINKILEIKIYF
jgi:hypothetical protein